MNRRSFLITFAAGAVSVMSGGLGEGAEISRSEPATRQVRKTKVALVRTRDRATGIRRAVELLGINPVKGQDVLLKPNFNTADPFPASTHNDTLGNLLKQLKAMGATSITIGERCGPPDTADVLKEKGIPALAAKHGARVINFEELAAEDWVRVRPAQSHWRDGFQVARPVLDAKCIVSTCCLKTHGYGGVFTMSLKLSVGITSKSNMSELHSASLNMRKMIAEINQSYAPSLIVMDGIDAFVDKGPSHGPVKQANVILAATDRIAIDATGLAVLKEIGSNQAIMAKKIFEQEQISRAVELGLGISGPGEIELVTDDEAGKEYSGRLMDILLKS